MNIKITQLYTTPVFDNEYGITHYEYDDVTMEKLREVFYSQKEFNGVMTMVITEKETGRILFVIDRARFYEYNKYNGYFYLKGN